MEHQTLGWWIVRPNDSAYYIEDCRIFGEYQDVQKLSHYKIDIFSCYVNFESHHLHDEMMNIAIKIATLDKFQDLNFRLGIKIYWVQLNRYETDSYFLQIFQSNSSDSWIISMFCKSCGTHLLTWKYTCVISLWESTEIKTKQFHFQCSVHKSYKMWKWTFFFENNLINFFMHKKRCPHRSIFKKFVNVWSDL